MDEPIENAELAGDNQPEMTLREELEKNLDEIRGRQESEADSSGSANNTAEEEGEQRQQKPVTTESPADKSVADQPDKTVAPTPAAKAPESWSAAEKTVWEKIPPEAQAAIARREADIHRGFEKMGQDAAAGRKFNEAINPYLPIIRAEGGDPVRAVSDLLNTAYVLRTATPERKVALFNQIAQQYNVDLSQVAQYQPRQVDPEVLHLRQQLEQVQGHLAGQHQEQVQHTQAEINRQIQAFSSDPKNEFFDQVREHMGVLIANNLASNLEQAYEQACYANPEVRSMLEQRSAAAAEAKRQEDARVKANAKRRAGSSINGSPGANVPSPAGNQNLSLRDELRANLRAATAS
ncbi:hypothetical protein WM40_22660 [Robbsia andropogonis]|uniref:Uncharacterized protein n=1 Tax=Robbsia andropogonis TaxID=28092 RepID=A0A0F5JV69_9BURK|nr:hypothetical protein [Robbsia andropogonis]KKB61545.1 hypothetical protein WM40_22660 [Robbsia andropogonis]